jgi:hypothetical protein
MQSAATHYFDSTSDAFLGDSFLLGKGFVKADFGHGADLFTK